MALNDGANLWEIQFFQRLGNDYEKTVERSEAWITSQNYQVIIF